MRARHHEAEVPHDPERRERLQQMAEEVGWYMVQEGLGEPEAIGKVLNRRGINNDEDRRRYFRELIPIIRRAGATNLAQDYRNRERAEESHTPRAQAQRQWAAEARRGGFDDAEDLLRHLAE